MVRIVRPCIALAVLLLPVSAAYAALPPYWESAREISAIVNDPAVHDALKYEEPIVSISTAGDGIYLLKTARCTLQVTLAPDPDAEPIAGPARFTIAVGAAECE